MRLACSAIFMTGLAVLGLIVAGCDEKQSARPTTANHAATTTMASSTVFRISSRPPRSGPTFAGIRQGRALQRARQLAISSHYRRDEPLFYRNTGDAAITQKTKIGSHSEWLVRLRITRPRRHCVSL